MALPTETSASPATRPATTTPAATAPTNGRTAPAVTAIKNGVVLYVDTSRVAVDLTAADGMRPGSLLSLRRDRVPIIHPVTGEVLGDLDEEVATARVTEVRDRFSLADLQTVAPGASVQIKDRVVAK
jgi:hypothetical protein